MYFISLTSEISPDSQFSDSTDAAKATNFSFNFLASLLDDSTLSLIIALSSGSTVLIKCITSRAYEKTSTLEIFLLSKEQLIIFTCCLEFRFGLTE